MEEIPGGQTLLGARVTAARPASVVPPYRAPWWLAGGHAQTIWPTFVERPAVAFRRERVTTTDGDFWDLDWVDASGGNDAPLVVLFHGLEGNRFKYRVDGGSGNRLARRDPVFAAAAASSPRPARPLGRSQEVAAMLASSLLQPKRNPCGRLRSAAASAQLARPRWFRATRVLKSAAAVSARSISRRPASTSTCLRIYALHSCGHEAEEPSLPDGSVEAR
jgi:hypothetical protein